MGLLACIMCRLYKNIATEFAYLKESLEPYGQSVNILGIYELKTS